MENPNLINKPLSFGMLPSSYLESLTYEEQLLWLCKKLEELYSFVNLTFEQQIINFINEKFDDIIVNKMYDENTETLILDFNLEEG